MASTSTHPTFAPRPYPSSLGKLPERSATGYGHQQQQQQQARDAQRLERERERAERERLEREGSSQLAELTEEQREEINEAVSPPISFPFFFCSDGVGWRGCAGSSGVNDL